MTKPAAAEVAALDPYKYMAIIGKTVIRPRRRFHRWAAAGLPVVPTE